MKITAFSAGEATGFLLLLVLVQMAFLMMDIAQIAFVIFFLKTST
jgi:F0F1-type ATP synthase assembly protein I